MSSQYSFSHDIVPPLPERLAAALAVDTGSPLVSVAVAVEGSVEAHRSTESRHSSSRLLGLIDDCLKAAGVGVRDVQLLVGLRGPGSFTGLRVGLATLQGLHLALATPTATLSTFQVLASLATPGAGAIVAAVDALRGEWLIQEFSDSEPPLAACEPRPVTTEQLSSMRTSQIIGFGVPALRRLTPDLDRRLVEPGPLAPRALELLDRPHLFDWSTDSLSHPLYLSPPAARTPGAASA